MIPLQKDPKYGNIPIGSIIESLLFVIAIDCGFGSPLVNLHKKSIHSTLLKTYTKCNLSLVERRESCSLQLCCILVATKCLVVAQKHQENIALRMWQDAAGCCQFLVDPLFAK